MQLKQRRAKRRQVLQHRTIVLPLPLWRLSIHLCKKSHNKVSLTVAS